MMCQFSVTFINTNRIYCIIKTMLKLMFTEIALTKTQSFIPYELRVSKILLEEDLEN